MDSLSQFSLGAVIGMAALGRKVGYRKAAVTGGVLGTLPDLDVFYPFDDPVDAFTLHRAATHSLFMHALATPVIGEGLRLAFKPLRDRRALAYLTVFLILTTHALLDAMTVYGTRIFWPLWPDAVGLGSIFIIDPLYTLPLVVALFWGLIAGGEGRRPGRIAAGALVLSTLYLGWSAAAQQWVEARAQSLLADAGIAPQRLLATPTPFNTFFWRVIAVEETRYHNLYIPVLGEAGPESLYSHARLTPEAACAETLPLAQRLARFADGFVKLGEEGGFLVVSDLRMGVTPAYVFRFAVAEKAPGGTASPIPPRRMPTARGAGESDVQWLLAGITGEATLRESEAAIALPPRALAGLETGNGASC